MPSDTRLLVMPCFAGRLCSPNVSGSLFLPAIGQPELLEKAKNIMHKGEKNWCGVEMLAPALLVQIFGVNQGVADLW